MRSKTALALVVAILSCGSASGDSNRCPPKDQACVVEQLELGVARGELASKVELALILLDQEGDQQNSTVRAVSLLEEVAGTGDAWSTTILAGLYRTGSGVEMNGAKVIELLEPLARNNNIAAFSGLGDLYASGAGEIVAEPERAATYYEKAAAGGDAHATFQLALMLINGTGIVPDVERGVKLLTELAQKGDPWVLIQLGDVYESGKARPQESAVAYFETAAEAGSAPAMVRLAQIYQKGLGSIPPNPERAKALLEAAAAEDDLGGRVLLAQLLLEGSSSSDTNRAISLLQQASSQGEPWPSLVLADVYAKGTKVPADGQRAIKILLPLAASGVAPAQVALGDIFASGASDIEQDLPRALRLFERAALKGDLQAKNRLGFALIRGLAGPPDLARGLPMLEEVIEHGDVWTALLLGDYFAERSASAGNAARAVSYYQKATDLGSPVGLSRLGTVYRTGLGEIAADRTMAAELFEEAANASDITGKINLSLMLLEDGGQASTDQALYLLDDAARSGDSWAATLLANILIEGKVTKPDGERALQLLEPLAQRRNPAALASLSTLYASGAGSIRPDTKKAANYLEQAAELGEYGAKSRLGLMLVSGQGIPADPPRGLQLLREVAEIGDGWAKIQLGDVLVSGNNLPVDVEGARTAYEAARQSGLVAGALRLGNLYLAGKASVSPDPERAAAYFSEAAEQGENTGRINLALMLLDGKGMDRNVDRAVDLLTVAASSGDAWANGTLGSVLADGRYLAPDYDGARKYFRAAEGAGDKGAMLRFGMILATGPLSPDHRQEGLELVQAAVASGFPGAAVEQARLQFMGLMGDNGAAAAEKVLKVEVGKDNPDALRLLLQVYRAGGPGLLPQPSRAAATLNKYEHLLTPETLSFEKVALRALAPPTRQSLVAIGADFGGIGRSELSQVLQMLFWSNQNAYVYVLQDRLRSAGLYRGELTGFLTRATIIAINKACREQGEDKVCRQGPLTPGVAALLGSYLAALPATIKS